MTDSSKNGLIVHLIHGSRYIDQADDLDAGALGRDGKPFNGADDAASYVRGNGADNDDEMQLAPIEWVEAALQRIPNDGAEPRPWDTWAGENGWNTIAMAEYRATAGSEEGFTAFDAWSAQHPTYLDIKRPPGATGFDRTRNRWEEIRRSPPNRIGWWKLNYLAQQSDPDFDAEFDAENIVLGPWGEAPGAADTSTGTGGAGASTGASADASEASADAPDAITVYDSDDNYVELEPPREWLLGWSICRGFVTTVSNAGGGAKTSLLLVQAMALATGRADITGEHVYEKCRVLVLSFEDDRTEIRRRIRAIRLRYGIGPDQTGGRLLYASLGPKHGKLAELDRQGRVRIGPLRQHIRQTIRRLRPNVVMFDPLVKTHAVTENDNMAMAIVAQCFTEMVEEENIAAVIAGHDRKGEGEPGADRLRGGGSTRDAHRLNFTLTRMSDKDAVKFGITDEAEQHRYLRYDTSKVNLCPPQNAKWYYLASVSLDNGDEIRPAGDSIQVIELRQPATTGGMMSPELAMIITEIDAGLPDGILYSNDNSARNRAAWKVAEKHCHGKTTAQCKSIIKELINNGILVHVWYWNSQRRAAEQGLLKQAG